MKINKISQFFDIRQVFAKLHRLLSLFAHPLSSIENIGNWKKLTRLPLVGEGITIKGKVSVNNPELIYLGSEVTLERGAVLEGRGGIVVCDGATINANAQILSDWDTETLTAKPAFIDNSGKALPKKRKQKSTALDKGDNIFFILSTGRAGSTSIAAILNQHPDITCLHEPNRLLIRLSTEYAHGLKTREEVKQELAWYYTKTSIFPGVVYGESDHKLFNLAELLAEILPRARFIWLIRNAQDFVASVYGRKWFDETYLSTRFPTVNLVEQQLIRYRIDGHQCGVFSEEAWQKMDQFEKVCWYWHYYNTTIEMQLQALPAERWHFVRLEELGDDISSLLQFLNVAPFPLKKKQKNKAHYERFRPEAWQPEQRKAYEQWCADDMKNWYSESEIYLRHN